MKSSVSWGWALLLAGYGGAPLAAAPLAQAGPAPQASPAPPMPGVTPDGYRPSTGERPGEVRYDEVGYAGVATASAANAAAMTAAHASLPPGSHAEVTALDSGKTVLVRIAGAAPTMAGRIVELSPAAAQALGLSAGAPVRVRAVPASAADASALASGGAAAPRADAPAPVLTALRRKLPARPAVEARPAVAARPLRFSAPPPAAGARGYLVQVAALSSAARARTVAERLGGRVLPAGSLYRIQLGPFADAAAAERARAQAARQGFADARVISSN